MKKGVSSIIAMVLLIVITIVVAVILKGWYMENLQRNQIFIQQMTDQKIGQMTEELKAISYDPSGKFLYVQNTGTAAIRITNPDSVYLISSYHNGTTVNWPWYYFEGGWTPYAANGVLEPGQTMRAFVGAGLLITDGYQITTVNGYSYSFVYGIGSVLLTANPQSRIANYNDLNGTSDNLIHLVATVYDSFGNPVPSSMAQTVKFEVSSAKAINPASASTNANGMATSDVTPSGSPGDVIARAYVSLPNGANVSGYSNVAYTPALQIVSFVANWKDVNKTQVAVTMVVRNNSLGPITSVVATFDKVGPGQQYLTALAAPASQDIPAGSTRSFTRNYTWSGGTSGQTYTFYFLGNADSGGAPPIGIHSLQSVSNTLTKVVS